MERGEQGDRASLCRDPETIVNRILPLVKLVEKVRLARTFFILELRTYARY
jgi:hypothetical protein